jgi:hypothetical protein
VRKRQSASLLSLLLRSVPRPTTRSTPPAARRGSSLSITIVHTAAPASTISNMSLHRPAPPGSTRVSRARIFQIFYLFLNWYGTVIM